MLEIYEDTCKKMGWEPRYFISELFKELEYSLQKDKGRLLLVDLPPGYGKSTATITLARIVIEDKNYDHFSRIIHVLPMRSIIEDLYNRVREALCKITKDADKYLAKQYMLNPGSPFFAKRCAITTLDTFILNFFKLPAHEIGKAFRDNISHFEFPRAMIYTSLVIFDEFHLFSGLGSIKEESKSCTAVLASITALLNAGVPIVVMTATIPPNLKSYLEQEVKMLGLEVKPIEYNEGFDNSFDEELKRKTKITRKINGVGDALKELESSEYDNKKVAIIFNTVKGAIDTYKKIRDEYKGSNRKIILAHGRLPEAKRESLINELGNRDNYILIATQVVEAGVDLNFDIMVTECCPADRLVQRAGRVARHSCYGEIWVFKAGEHQPYDTNVINRTWNMLNNIKELDWTSSKRLIEEVYKDLELKPSQSLLHSLKYLDRYPIFGIEEAKEAFEYFKGFTDSAGIVSIYREGDFNTKNAIPLSERDLIGDVLKLIGDDSIKLLTYDNKEGKIRKNVIYANKGKISVFMLKEGYKGIIVNEQIYNNLIGGDNV
jgi:CRISPR-associated endonuclease/helicase Cas3